ncbi:MAG: hypothetical protein ACO3FE_09405 [Planctomycetaceae bacterium]
MRLMLSLQLETGTWGSLDCWPPFESDAFHEATVAAMAIATAPGWLESVKDDGEVTERINRLHGYLRTEKPPHDYGRVLLLWAAARSPELLQNEQVETLTKLLMSKQHADGSWTIRDFASPEEWGGGNRAEKLRAEPDLETPAGDGHMTGLAIIVLRESGHAAEVPEITRAVNWLKSHQQQSGRWWTRSLNTDSWHFITYSGTAYIPTTVLNIRTFQIWKVRNRKSQFSGPKNFHFGFGVGQMAGAPPRIFVTGGPEILLLKSGFERDAFVGRIQDISQRYPILHFFDPKTEILSLPNLLL